LDNPVSAKNTALGLPLGAYDPLMSRCFEKAWLKSPTPLTSQSPMSSQSRSKLRACSFTKSIGEIRVGGGRQGRRERKTGRRGDGERVRSAPRAVGVYTHISRVSTLFEFRCSNVPHDALLNSASVSVPVFGAAPTKRRCWPPRRRAIRAPNPPNVRNTGYRHRNTRRAGKRVRPTDRGVDVGLDGGELRPGGVCWYRLPLERHPRVSLRDPRRAGAMMMLIMMMMRM
jgi:hypothetical protein